MEHFVFFGLSRVLLRREERGGRQLILISPAIRKDIDGSILLMYPLDYK